MQKEEKKEKSENIYKKEERNVCICSVKGVMMNGKSKRKRNSPFSLFFYAQTFYISPPLLLLLFMIRIMQM